MIDVDDAIPGRGHKPGESAAPEMVTLVRQAKGWTQADLQDAVNVHEKGPNKFTQGYISKVENGMLQLRGPRLEQVATALGCPSALLLVREPRRGLEVSCVFHRRRKSTMTVAVARKVEAVGHLTRLTVDRLFDGVEEVGSPQIQRLDIDEVESPEAVARVVRARWRIPSGPVENLTQLLEDMGVVVVVRQLDTAGQDAFSTWPPGGRPLTVVAAGLSPDRYRFTLAHELGHVLMHVMPNPDQERQANRFAAELLTPADEIGPELKGLTTRDMSRLMELKANWRVSIGMLVQRAKDLNHISERQFKEFRIRLARLGWDRAEPIELPAERPRLLATVVRIHQQTRGTSTHDLAELALMTPDGFARHYLLENGSAA
jgi:Zn-dependent peptidase ImmA (M78 family)/transcriptional regulator with XRE-family HTH domain